MLNVKTLLLFAVKSLGIYAIFILLISSSGADKWYAQKFRHQQQKMMNAVIDKGKVRLIGMPIAAKNLDTRIEVQHKAYRQQGWFGQSLHSRYIGLLPLLVVLTLILSTTFPNYKRKMLALAAGFVLINLFTFIVLTVKSYAIFADVEQVMNSSVASSLFNSFMSMLNDGFSEQIGLLVVVPVFIWIMVSFRRSDWKFLAQQLEQPIQKQAIKLKTAER